MPANASVPSNQVQQLRRRPTHAVLQVLGRAAIDAGLHRTAEFKKLIAYVMEKADGRDRRDPWTQKPGVARPVPRLRIALEQCFGHLADLQWFKLNKIVNGSGQPLVGTFPRMAASLARITPQDFGDLIEALVSAKTDPAVLRYLHERGGKVRGMGLELFSRIAYAFRRDLFFIIPPDWGETSGCIRFIDGDLRRYCALCRTLRSVCDALEIDAEVRGSVFYAAVTAERRSQTLDEAIAKAIGPNLARHTLLRADDAHDADRADDEQLASPLNFAARSIRARRGDRRLRDVLLKHYGDHCAISGPCPRDLLEVAYIAPYPSGDVHARDNVLLLRSDLHALWDLDLLRINPERMTLQLSPKLRGTEYERFAEKQIAFQVGGLRPDREALRQRWRLFAEKGERTSSAETPAKSPSRSDRQAVAAPRSIRPAGTKSIVRVHSPSTLLPQPSPVHRPA